LIALSGREEKGYGPFVPQWKREMAHMVRDSSNGVGPRWRD